MMFRLACTLPLLAIAAGCTNDPSDAAAPDSPEPDAAGAAPTGHVVGLDAILTPDDDAEHVTFLNPAASPSTLLVSEVVGKPYYAALFQGGFDQGFDLDLDHVWGTVPESLVIEYRSPPDFQDGPYDLALIVYTQTPITDATREDLIPPTPGAGELSAFTLSQDRVKEGDPGFGAGVIRVNVEGADTFVTLENRVPEQIDAGSQVLRALEDTILAVP